MCVCVFHMGFVIQLLIFVIIYYLFYSNYFR